MKRCRRGVLLFAAALCLLPAACIGSGEEPGPPPSQQLPAKPDPSPGPIFIDFADVVEEVRPAVVNIYTRTRRPAQRPPLGPQGIVPPERIEESLGSGFLFHSDGLVLTNDHVIADAAEIAVRLLDERIFSAQVVGRDPQTDTAVLRLLDVEDPLPSLSLGDSDALRVGSWVLAIGNPLGLTSTVTAGIASATGRQVLPPGDTRLRFQDFIQTDASINPGNSGGPLINADGEVVGIATAVSAAGQGLGFAIPINMVREILPDLLEEGRVERSWLGVYVSELPPALRRELDLPQGGVLITKTVPGSPAEEAGLLPGDVLLSLGDQPISEPSALAWAASNLGVGLEIQVQILRGNQRRQIPLTMGALPE